MRTIVTALLLILGISPCLPQHIDEEVKDSLLILLNRAEEDTTRIRLLQQLVYATQNEPAKNIEFAQDLYETAVRSKNEKVQCRAIYGQLITYANINDTANFNRCLQLLKSYADRDASLRNYYFQGQYIQVEQFIQYEAYEKAESHALSLLSEAQREKNLIGELGAYQSLAHIYQSINQPKKAIGMLEKAYELNKLPQLAANYSKMYDTFYMFITLYSETKDYEKCLRYVKELDEITQTHLEKVTYRKNSYDNILLYIENSYILCYLKMNDLAATAKHIEKAKEYVNEQAYKKYISDYHFLCHEYYKQQKEYEKALQELDLSIKHTPEYLQKNRYQHYRADMLAETGNVEEALSIYRTLVNEMDSVHHADIKKQSQQIMENHDLDKRKLEHLKTQNKVNRILLYVVVTACILGIIFFIRIIRLHHALKKTEKELEKTAGETLRIRQEKNKFIRTLHERIRLPLNTIIGYSRMLMEKGLNNTDRQNYLQIIQNNLEELQKQIKDIHHEVRR